MRLSTFFLLIVGAAALAAIGWVFLRATADQRAWRELLSYTGKPPGALDAAQLKRLKQLMSRRIPPGGDDLALLGIYRLDPEGRVLVVEAATRFTLPSSFSVRAHVLSSQGVLESSVDFSGGWRMDWISCEIIPSVEAGGPVLKAKIDNGFGGADVDCQYYAVVDGRLALIRLEDDGGRVAPNQYWATNLMIGPIPPDWDPERWERSLHADNPAQVLATLCWLGGKHLDPLHLDRESYHESKTAARAAADLRRRPTMNAHLRELMASPNRWIAEAATAASIVKENDD